MREAEDALRSWLADGPVEVKALKKLAEEVDIGWRTLERAKRCLGVKTEKRGGPGIKNGPWMWRLLEEDRQPGALAVFSGEPRPRNHLGGLLGLGPAGFGPLGLVTGLSNGKNSHFCSMSCEDLFDQLYARRPR